MIISNGKMTLDVTEGAYENYYANQGFKKSDTKQADTKQADTKKSKK